MLLHSVLGKTVRDGRRGLVAWSLGIAALVLLTCSVYPSVGGNEDYEKLIENYPEELKAFIGGSLDLTSGPGYLQAELFSLMVPLLLLVYAIGAGGRALAGEEEAGTLDLLLAHPVSRGRVVLEKAGALVVTVTVLSVALFAVVLASVVAFDMGVTVANVAAGTLHAWALALAFGAFALAVGGASGSRALAIAIPTAVVVAAYLVDGLANLVDVLEPLAPFSPWHWYIEGEPLRHGVRAGAFLLLATAAVLTAVSVTAFRRRDLSV
ncbi:MAG: ABC transporter permease subunit [Pseudomonadota bacterium]